MTSSYHIVDLCWSYIADLDTGFIRTMVGLVESLAFTDILFILLLPYKHHTTVL